MAESTALPSTTSPCASDAPPGLVITCQCGAVRFRTATPQPLSIVHCHCTECRRQSASAFGTSAYFPAGPGFFPLPPAVAAAVGMFTRPTASGNTMHCYFCTQCGVRLLHVAYLPDGTMRPVVSVKAGSIEDAARLLDWRQAKHQFVSSAVMPLAAEWETYPEAVPRGSTSMTAAQVAAATGAAAARDVETKAKTE